MMIRDKIQVGNKPEWLLKIHIWREKKEMINATYLSDVIKTIYLSDD